MVLVSVCILVPKYACEAVMSDVASLSTVTCCNYWVFELTNAWNTGKSDRYKKGACSFKSIVYSWVVRLIVILDLIHSYVIYLL